MPFGLAADLGAGAARSLDRGEDRPGPRPGSPRHRQRRVAAGGDEPRVALEGERRRQELLVVEAAMSGDDDDPRPAPRLALEHLEARRRDRVGQRLGADHEGARALARDIRR